MENEGARLASKLLENAIRDQHLLAPDEYEEAGRHLERTRRFIRRLERIEKAEEKVVLEALRWEGILHERRIVHRDAERKLNQEACLEAMLLMKAVGDTAAVGRWLKNGDLLELAERNVEAANYVAECKAWLAESIKFEEKNGRGSMLNKQHPFLAEVIEPARLRAAQIIAADKIDKAGKGF